VRNCKKPSLKGFLERRECDAFHKDSIAMPLYRKVKTADLSEWQCWVISVALKVWLKN
jgi:hypothetical protein